MFSTHDRHALLLATALALLATAGTASDILDGEQRRAFDAMVEKQNAIQADSDALERRLERSRAERRMHDEAILLNALNIAWIHDQIDNWDCRLIEHQQAAIETRLTELAEFVKRVESVCAAVSGPATAAQRGACAAHQRELALTRERLEALGTRYATQGCRGDAPQSPPALTTRK